MRTHLLFLAALLTGLLFVLLFGIRTPQEPYRYSGSFPVASYQPDFTTVSTPTEREKPAEIQSSPVLFSTAIPVEYTPAFYESNGSATIQGEAGSLSEQKELTIDGLTTEATPPLDQGMVNVTGEHSAFRMLPHGEFEKDVTVILPYDTTLIPAGYSEREIYTYYYNESLKRWMMLKRDSVDMENKLIVSKVNHFTDFINAIIKTPEMPEAQAYTPTSIKDLKAANPLEGMALFQPPTANNNGTANMSYPVEVPAGRQGMQPNLAVTYNSSGGNGWLGIGWDISIPAITVDTRWGVPRYNGSKESEVYMHQGEQLVTKNAEGKHDPMPHRTNSWKNRNSNGVKQFYPRVEEAFDSIVRHGTTPANYWWSVTDRHGITSYYGKTKGVDSFDPQSVLRDVSGNIAHWALTETVDPYGNTVRYYYDLVTDYNDAAQMGNSGRQLYLNRINYTGYENEEGKYTILFNRLDKPRADVTVNARYGFKEISARLLCNIQIRYENETLLAYYFFTENNRNSNYKTRLTDMVRLDEPEYIPSVECKNEIHRIPWGKCKALRYNFEYYDYPTAQNLFGSAVEQRFPNDNVRSTFLTNAFNIGDGWASALGGTKGKSWSAGGTVALGLGPNVCMTTVSLGGNFSYSGSGSEGLLTLIDLDGDGLMDKVFKQNGKIYYRKQTASSDGTLTFGNRVELSGLEDFLTESSENIDWGLQASAGLSLNGAWPTTTSTTSTYFADVNGDGLPDLITEKRGVLFNSLQNGKPTFTPFQVLASPDPAAPSAPATYVVTSATAPCGGIIFDGEVNDSIACRTELAYIGFCKTTDPVYPLYVDSGYIFTLHDACAGDTACTARNVYKKHITCEPVLTDPDLDAVRVWVAPYSGTITLHSNIRLLEDTSESRRQSRFANGVRYSAQWNGSNHILGVLPGSNERSNAPLVSGVKNELFSRVIAKDNYSPMGDTVTITVSRNDLLFFRLQSGGSRAFDNVQWTQQIIYRDISGTDDFGKDKSRYHSDEDFILHSNVYFQAPESGSITVSGQLRTGNLYRNARLYIYRNSSVVHSYPLTSGMAVEVNRTFTVNQFDDIKFIVKGDNDENTTWSDIYFSPRLKFTGTFTCDGNPPVTDSLVYHPAMQLGMSIFAHSTLEKRYKKLFGALYRGWGQFCYNNNYPGGAITGLIDESKLLLPGGFMAETSSEVDTNEFYLDHSVGENMSEESLSAAINAVYNPLSTNTRWVEMQADGELGGWVGFGNINYIKGDTMSNTRTKRYISTETGDSEEEIPVYDSPVPVSIDGSPVKTLRKQNKSELHNYSFNGSIPVISVSMGASSSGGNNTILSDYMDLNGDRYPDFIGAGGVQYSTPWGGIGVFEPLPNAEISRSSTNSNGQTFGASFLMPKRGASNNPKSSKVSFDGSGSMGASHGSGTDQTDFMYMDINGDGLPDKVYRNGNVSLNTGYTFLPAENWKHNFIRNGKSSNVGVNMGGNFSISQASIGGGIGLNMAENETTHQLMDINGDGLPDKVTKNGNVLSVSYNLGNGNWSAAETLSPDLKQISQGKSYSESVNGSVTAGFTFFGVLKFTIGVQSAPYNRSFSKETEQFADMNNDGFVDYVTSSDETGMKVYYNQAGKTNLLKKVTNFTGAFIELDYHMPLSSYEQPQRSWDLASVKTQDPFTPAGGNTTYAAFTYETPHYNRFERIAYGYAKITSKEFDTENNNELYRYTEEEFNNLNFIKKGRKTRDCLYDKNGKPYIETLYEAQLVDMNSGQPVGDENCPSEVFPMFEADVTHYYEGNAQPQISTAKSRTYDKKRNIIQYINRGDLAIPEDDLKADITYYTGMPHNLVSLVEQMKVADHQGTVLRHREAEYNHRGKLARIRQIGHALTAQLDFEYDDYGNTVKMTFPENESGQRNFYQYTYDNEVKTYPAQITGALGYHSSAHYDFRWGKPILTLDINGNEMRYVYNNLGLLDSMSAPYEIAAGNVSTISISRFPVNYKRFDIFTAAAEPFSSAQTSHHDPGHPGNRIYTVIYCDGSGRMLQTQKTSVVEGEDRMIVSGRVLYDPFGRTLRQNHPVTVPASAPDPITGRTGSYCYDYAPNTATFTYYDILDRKTRVILPSAAVTRFSYGFDTDAFGKLRFAATTEDALNNTVTTLSDYRQLQTTVTAPMNTITTFKYNPLGELLESTDPDGHATRHIYNQLGQRTARNHPDAGTTEWRYDPAGNVTAMTTANLSGTGQSIQYKYYYNQLTEINYPQHPENNVKYSYGDVNAPDNGKGRVVAIEDATSFQTFSYGKLGEVIENKRTFVLPHDVNSYTFIMKWEYDSWNRIKNITYPDGEQVFYRYNRGGLLEQMWGEKQNEHFEYVTDVKYNKFEAKTGIGYGNGTSAQYEYDILQRLSSLASYTSEGELMQRITYKYDSVSNITKITNAAGEANGLGGSYAYQYSYDDLYRLTNSEGGWNNGYNYSLKMEYAPDGKITRKAQSFEGNMGHDAYNYDYTYNNEQPHTIYKISNGQMFEWDKNGNMTAHQNGKGFELRRLCWDEENRLSGVADDKYASFYYYDAGGERTVKLVGENQWIDVNGIPQGFSVINNPTLYSSAYLVASRKGYTKHYYIENQRITSKIGQGGLEMVHESPIADEIYCMIKSKHLNVSLGKTAECLNANNLDKEFIEYEDKKGWLVNLYKYKEVLDTENELFFYHPDHLGSSSWITNAEGKPIQHLSYLPFGEEFVDQRTSDFSAAFKFSGKEKDEETGYNYFGARYYMSDLSIWGSVDPLSDKYPSLSAYNYCANNPIILVDPDGRKIVIKGENGESITYTANMKYEGEDAFTKKMVDNYNKIYTSKSGSKVLDRVIGSNKTYTMDNKKGGGDSPEAGSKGAHFNGQNDINTTAHELFHNYQYDMKQGGGSIQNEVEAYLFEMIVSKDIGISSTGVLAPITPKENSILYQNSKNAYMTFDNLSELSGNDFDKNFNAAVKGFKSFSIANSDGLYSKFPTSLEGRARNLIKEFYPIKPK